MPQNQNPIRNPGERLDAYIQRVTAAIQAEDDTVEETISYPQSRYTTAPPFPHFTDNLIYQSSGSPIAPETEKYDRRKLQIATQKILHAVAVCNRRPHIERRERDYINIIRNQNNERVTPSEIAQSEKPMYLPYLGYGTLAKLQEITSGLSNKSGQWTAVCHKTKLELPIEFMFLCMGQYYSAPEIPTPQTCKSCEYVKSDCSLVKDYQGKEMYLCGDCVNQTKLCVECSNEIALAFYDEQLCIDCINKVDPRSPLRRFYLGKKWCGAEPGKLMQSTRVFSFEIEATVADHAPLIILGGKLPQEAGLSGDSSIRSGGGMGIEIQSPQLAGTRGEEFANRTAGVLKEVKATVNDSCGMHVHLDGGGIIPLNRQAYPKALVDLWKAHIVFEDVVFSVLPFNRRLNRFCRPLRDYFKVSEIEMIETMFDAEKLWYKHQDSEAIRSEKQHHHHASRYFGVNFHSLFANNHLELRHHSGTLNAKKVLQWANLHALIMDAAEQGVFTQEFLAEAQATTNVKDKTEMLFKAIGLSKSSRQYFYQRQAKFVNKKEQEDGLTPIASRVIFRPFLSFEEDEAVELPDFGAGDYNL